MIKIFILILVVLSAVFTILGVKIVPESYVFVVQSIWYRQTIGADFIL